MEQVGFLKSGNGRGYGHANAMVAYYRAQPEVRHSFKPKPLRGTARLGR